MVLLPLLSVAFQGSTTSVDLIPKPVSANFQGGAFDIGKGFHVQYIGGGQQAASLFLKGFGEDRIESKPGGQVYVYDSNLPVGWDHAASAGAAGDSAINFVLDKSSEQGPEGYRLQVTDNRVTVTAGTETGLFYGGVTLRQLIGHPGDRAETIPGCDITDAPSYGWRGLLLDVSRHFRPKADIERYLDLMAFHKLNVFHWHLVDDGGWRIEIKKYPELTRRGAWRSKPKESWGGDILFPAQHSKDEYGGFYTQKDIKEVVAYAAARGITIVPEIEMPGHSLAAINCYPEVACTKPDKSGPVINSNYCPGKETTFKFLTGVLDEVLTLFPSKFIHIGGDEVDKATWKECPDCQARIKNEGLKNEEELQSYFIKRMEKYLNSKGRRLIGWDEILEGGLAPNATVMSWRGIQGGIEAAKQGKNVVMCPTSHCYFDYSYGGTPTSKVYSYNPIPDELSGDQGKLILGGQGNLWTEWIPTRERLDEMTYPRAAALAEVFWTPKAEQGWADFEHRLSTEYRWLTHFGVDFMPPEPNLAVSAVLTKSPTTIDFGPAGDGLVTLRYSADGKDPKATSPILAGKLDVKKDGVYRAAYFNPLGTHGDVASVTVHIGNFDAPDGQLAPGLNVAYYEGEWENLPDLSKETAVSTTEATDIGLDVRKRDTNYGLRFTGYVDIPADGTYTFFVTSDDGAKLSIGGAPVVDDGLQHGPREKAGRIELLKGRYPISLDYFQAGGAQALKVEVAGPGIEKMGLPSAWLGHSK